MLRLTYEGEAAVSPVQQSVDVAPNPLARALATLPEVWQSLLVEHESDEHGRCRSCRSAGRPGVIYPCTLRVAAEDARELARAIPSPR